ncbi:MAG TPA: sulfatase-like hydrolase/transferase, partial [Chloroflexota bacterium]|nr:sulfatase-like hydrolase/transferase [Chloroflexota bacterium]
PLCVPARISLWTGRWPHSHGARTNEIPMPPQETHFARLLHEHGYTLAHFGKNHCFTPDDLDRYFDHVFLAGHGDRVAEGVTMVHSGPQRGQPVPDTGGVRRPVATVRAEPPEQSATYRVVDEATRYLDQRAESAAPFCLWVSIPDPHTPLQVPEPYASRYPPSDVPLPPWREGELDTKPERQRVFSHLLHYDDLREDDVRLAAGIYYGMIDFIDERVGHLLDTLERLHLRESTLVVFTADHGDYLGEHHLLAKSNAFYDCLTRVPLLLSCPGSAAGTQRVGHPVSLIDVMPTLLTLAGVPLPDGVQGQLLPGLPISGAPRDAVFSEYGAGGPPVTLEVARRLCPPGQPRILPPLLRQREGEGHGKMVFDGRWKYCYDSTPTGGEELYDLQDDPWELTNLASRPEHAATIERLRRRLLDWMLETENARPVPLHYDTAALASA